MKHKEIHVTVKRTIQTASYESSSIEITSVVEVEPDDDIDEVRSQVYAETTKLAKRAIDNEWKKYKDTKAERDREQKNQR
jgi:hypothetical protein